MIQWAMPARPEVLETATSAGRPRNLSVSKDIVDLLVLQKTVRMDARPGHIEVLADERRSGRHMVADLLLIVFCQLCDDSGVHSIQSAAKLGVLKYHSLQRRVLPVRSPMPNREQLTPLAP